MTRDRRHILRLRRAAPVALVLLLAACLRLPGLGDESLWGDEMVTVMPAKMPLPQLVRAVAEWEQIPLLQHVVLHLWLNVFPDTDASIRTPFALAGIAGVFAMYVLARRVLERRAALAAMLLLAVSPMHIAYSREARSYAFLVLLALIATDVFARLLRRPTQRLHALYAVAIALTLYTHLHGIFLVLAHHLFYLWRLWQRGRSLPLTPRVWLIDNLAAAALFSPWVPVAVRWTRAVATNFWVKSISLDTIAHTYWTFSGSLPVFLAMIVLVTVGLVATWRGRPASRRNGVVLMLLLMLVPVVVPIVIAVLTRPGFVHRHGIVGVVGMCALAGAGVAALRPRGLRVTVLAVVAVVSPLGRAAEIPREPFRELAAYLNANVRSGDLVVVHCRAGKRLYDRYVRRDDVQARFIDTNSLPVSFPLEPPGRRIWLVIYAPAYPANVFVRRAPVRIERRWLGYDLLAMELTDLPWGDGTPAGNEPSMTTIEEPAAEAASPGTSSPGATKPATLPASPLPSAANLPRTPSP